jgi:hypothetical protein
MQAPSSSSFSEDKAPPIVDNLQGKGHFSLDCLKGDMTKANLDLLQGTCIMYCTTRKKD